MNLGSSFKNIAVVFDVVMFLSSFLDFHDEEIIDCLQISKIRITSKLREDVLSISPQQIVEVLYAHS